MNKDPCSFMNMFQHNAFMHDCECFLLFCFFALEAIRIVLAFMSSKIFHFELEAIPFRYRLLELRMDRLSNVDRVSEYYAIELFVSKVE